MRDLNVLGRKDKKKFLVLLKKQFGFEGRLNYTFLINNKNKIFAVNNEIAGIDLERIRINSAGSYIAELKNNEVRLSIEGSQLIGPRSDKNIFEVDEKEARNWLKGEDLESSVKEDGFVILRCNEDYIGCGKAVRGKVINFIPKTRRLNVSD